MAHMLHICMRMACKNHATKISFVAHSCDYIKQEGAPAGAARGDGVLIKFFISHPQQAQRKIRSANFGTK